MLRLETNDLSKAAEIIRHPEIVAQTGVPLTGPLCLTGPDRCTILIMDDTEPVGYAGFWFKDQTHREAELGTGVLPEYRTKELVPLYHAIVQTIYILGAETINCRIQSSNLGAIKGAKILGFEVTRQHGGETHLALPKSKWYAMHPTMRN